MYDPPPAFGFLLDGGASTAELDAGRDDARGGEGGRGGAGSMEARLFPVLSSGFTSPFTDLVAPSAPSPSARSILMVRHSFT